MNMLYDENCFACGLKNDNGIQAEFSVNQEKMEANCHITIKGKFQGWEGIVHGGIISTLLDEVSVYACTPISAAEGLVANATATRPPGPSSPTTANTAAPMISPPT